VVQINRKQKNSVSVRISACQRCGGDAFLDLLDEPEWRCLQCGRVVPELAVPEETPARLPVAA
jgi:hypothetical protein